MTPGSRLFDHRAFEAATLAGRRGTGPARRSVSVCIPARDEAATIGPIVAGVRRHLVADGGGVDLVDEVIVADDGSSDGTAEAAAAAGARVVTVARHARTGPDDDHSGVGKGAAMRAALDACSGDLVVFLDGDVEDFSPHFVTGLLGPLLDPAAGAHDDGHAPDAAIVLVKGFYERPLAGVAGEGGRVTELVAKPAIELLFPDLTVIRQPLAGETAARRAVLEAVDFPAGYGIEVALLVDVAERYGVEAVAQVDLGVRVHRNRPLAQLRGQAVDVLRTALERAGLKTAGST